jgi:Transposase IS66 family
VGEPLDLSDLPDGVARERAAVLVQIVEAQAAEIAALRAAVQALRDEVARLKGEQGKPEVRPQARRGDHSSEAARPQEPRPPRQPDARALLVEREEVRRVDRATLPPDAEFKGLEPFTVQDVVLRGEAVRYLREKWYAASTGKTYLAALPPGVADHYGPQVKALALALYHAGGMSEPKVLELLTSVGLQVSAGTLSGWLVADLAALHAEAADVYAAGLASAPFQQIDDTATRVNGENHHCQVVCNPLYTSYHTTPAKDRLTVVDVLRPGQEGTYLVDEVALGWLEAAKVSAGVRAQVAAHLPRDTILGHAELVGLLDERLGHLGTGQRARIVDAAAIAAYHAQTTLPVVEVLVCDDAGQFVGVTLGRALCWVHDARHYNKLCPLAPENRERLQAFMADYWAFYAALLAYRQAYARSQHRSPTEADRLRARFDALFTRTTGYLGLDERIAKTHAHRAELLLVLDHPELPLHNNHSELGARRRVRKRDASFGPRTQAGANAWDTMQTLAATAQQHGVNFLHYLQDRRSGARTLPSLADLIRARAADLHLDASWTPDAATPTF